MSTRYESGGWPVEHWTELASTNQRALELARGGADRACVVADTQSAGRGQHGRSWSSPVGKGLYVSFVERPELPLEKTPLLTLWVGTVLHDALTPHCSTPLGLKWPNDLLAARGPLRGRKLAGILVESAVQGDALDYAVIGIGLNLQPARHSPEAESRAVSLSELGGPALEVESALSLVAEALDRGLEDLDIDAVAPRWTERAVGVGSTVRLRFAGQTEMGTLVGINPTGALRLRNDSGIHTFVSGRLELEDHPGLD